MACFGEDLELVFAYLISRRTKKGVPISYSFIVRSSMDSRYHIPCICPIISSLSRRSVPANRSNLPPRAARNFLLNPINQPSQKGCVAARSVRQIQLLAWLAVAAGSRSWCNSEGTEMRADVALRIVRERVLWMV